MNNKKSIVISLGGSLIIPKEGFNTNFLRAFRKAVLSLSREGYKFILVCGGGRTARNYIEAADTVSKLSLEEKDWLGIEATKLNAHFMRTIFGASARREIIDNPTRKMNCKENILIGAGWKPGCSTDFDAVLLAKTYGAKKVINLTDVDWLYNKNPKIYKDAKKIKTIDWAGFRKIVGEKFVPGANTPFDPVASRMAQKLGLELILANGKKIDNLKKIIKGDKFTGSVVY